jgi:hypothetical protein
MQNDSMGVSVDSRADESGAYLTSTIRVPGYSRWDQQGRTLHLRYTLAVASIELDLVYIGRVASTRCLRREFAPYMIFP